MRGLLFESSDGLTRFVVDADGPTVVLGRRPPPERPNVFIPDDPRISRQHLRLRGTEHGFVVEDTSHGGVYLDGTRVVTAASIGPGAVLQLHGDLSLTARAVDTTPLRAALPLHALDARRLLVDVTRRLVAHHAAGHAMRHWGTDDIVRFSDGTGYELLVHHRPATDDLPCYLAPDEPLGPPADLYTLGLVYFEALAGRLPFPGTTAADIMNAKRHGALPALEPRWDLGIRDYLSFLLDSNARTRITAPRFYDRLTEPYLD